MPTSLLDLPEEILEACVGYVALDNPHFYGSTTDIFDTEGVVFGPPRDILHLRLEHDVEIEVLSLLPLVTQAKNLRLLRVHIPDIFESPDADADCNEIVNALLRQPSLQTVIMRDTRRLELLPLGPTNILNLRIYEYHALFSLLPLTPQLQALAIPESNYPQSFPSNTLLPWGTLRELEICGGFENILINLLCWKNMYQDRHVPLKEVSLYGTVVESAQIAQFLQIFGGIPLTTLYLECLRVIDDVVLKDIVNAFPKLQRLIIRSKRLNTQWKFDLEELVERFSNLQDLEYLGWDYTSVLTGLASVYETGNEEDDFIQRDDLGDVDHVDWWRSGAYASWNSQCATCNVRNTSLEDVSKGEKMWDIKLPALLHSMSYLPPEKFTTPSRFRCLLDLPEEILEACVGYVAMDNPHFYGDIFDTESVVFGPRRDILHLRLERDVEVEILSLLPLATQAKNLRLLRVYLPDISESPDTADCNKIFNALLRQPLLQTVIILDKRRLELLSFAPTNILNLRINNYDALFSLLPLTPQLQALAIPDSNDPLSFPSSTLLPWGTLRELECWKNMHQDRHAPLKEVSFYGAVVESTQIAQFLQIFEGIPLTTLYLECLSVIDDVVLSDLVDAFPKLQRLIILSEDHNTQWDFALEALARRFSKLQDLEYLGWDYTSVLTSVCETADGADALRMTSRAIVPIMALACPRLQVVEYFQANVPYAFRIERDDQGDVDHVDCCLGGSLEYPTLQTSFWVKCLDSICELVCFKEDVFAPQSVSYPHLTQAAILIEYIIPRPGLNLLQETVAHSKLLWQQKESEGNEDVAGKEEQWSRVIEWQHKESLSSYMIDPLLKLNIEHILIPQEYPIHSYSEKTIYVNWRYKSELPVTTMYFLFILKPRNRKDPNLSPSKRRKTSKSLTKGVVGNDGVCDNVLKYVPWDIYEIKMWDIKLPGHYMALSLLDLPEEILEVCVGYVALDNPHFYDIDILDIEDVVFGPPRDILHLRLEHDVEVEVSSLLPLVTQAKNLRLLRVYMPYISESPDTDADYNEIVNALLRQPLLQTVIIRDTFPLQFLPLAPTNILNLRINNYHALFSLLPLTPQLQALAIPGSNDPLSFPSSILLPWETLRELEMYDGFEDIVNNLLCWKNMHQDRHVPLKEVSLYGAVVEPTQIAQFLQIFEGIPLTTLYLECLSVIDDVVLNSLVNAFPKLQRLIILSEGCSTQWDFTLEALARRFSKLQDLEYLGWDYFSVITSVCETADGADALRMISRAIVPIMALACPRLQVVQYFHTYFSYVFSIQRDNERDVDRVDWRPGDSLHGPTLQTSFWVKCLDSILFDRIASARLVMFGIPH
ncbi:hypothetical protein BU17DRAFT_61814 [Hysterangium stoloniferum]|nr:hypothetical protein BU17DRAFT_61814 [Hysterangium stoloniferum]